MYDYLIGIQNLHLFHQYIVLLGIFCNELSPYIYIRIYMHKAYIKLSSGENVNCFHLKKGIYTKPSDLSKFYIHAVSCFVLLCCRPIYSQHHAPYEHICVCIYIT